jgi:hypothetical protein
MKVRIFVMYSNLAVMLLLWKFDGITEIRYPEMRQVNKDFKNNASLVTKKSVAQD